jgi:hypothetical protein
MHIKSVYTTSFPQTLNTPWLDSNPDPPLLWRMQRPFRHATTVIILILSIYQGSQMVYFHSKKYKFCYVYFRAPYKQERKKSVYFMVIW